MLTLRRIVFGILAVALISTSALAQPTAGTVKGTLTDDSGGVIPAASVSLAGHGAAKTAQTQADGTYTFTGVAPGDYTVTISFPGFQPFTKPVTVTAGGTVQVPIQLALKVEKQEIMVQGEAGPTLSVEPDNNATAVGDQGRRPAGAAGRPRRPGGRAASSGRTWRGPEWRTDLYRRFQRWPVAAEGIDSRNPHQPESVLGGIRPTRVRTHRNPHQARHRQIPRRA